MCPYIPAMTPIIRCATIDMTRGEARSDADMSLCRDQQFHPSSNPAGMGHHVDHPDSLMIPANAPYI